ncbi:MAG: sugar nucleotide-binding protein, partial [Chloroflexi bacterium]|nr:sugar nucleotide-binding protein [Chloroflexota bacterium]
MDTIAVTGHRGRLGSELVKRGCVPLDADVTDFYELNQAILKIKPDAIIHSAAQTDVDACETQMLEAM